jgi:rRNA maturation endonuclease Nob1
MMDTTLLLVLGAILAAGAGVWVYLRARSPTAIRFFHFRCPGCRRRLRYKEPQAGHKGECSNCGRELIFPPVSESTN